MPINQKQEISIAPSIFRRFGITPSVFLSFIFIILPSTAISANLAKTRFGEVRIKGDFQDNDIYLNDKKIDIPGSAGNNNYLLFDLGDENYVRAFTNVDALIMTATEGQCPLYRVLKISKSGARVSKSFGTCDDGPKLHFTSDAIAFEMKDSKGRIKKYMHKID